MFPWEGSRLGLRMVLRKNQSFSLLKKKVRPSDMTDRGGATEKVLLGS